MLRYRPSRLDAVETVYAMTVHKSQGSQFDTAVVLLPPAPADPDPESLYTAITRASACRGGGSGARRGGAPGGAGVGAAPASLGRLNHF